MEIEAFKSENELLAPTASLRAKSSVRMHYEAQVGVIIKQLGDLEKIRENLGLSQRKICQLLMVDPSAWTRWTKKNENPPPHIYRALQWYMILQEKLPGLTPQYFVGKDPEVLHQSALRRIQEEEMKRLDFEEAIAAQSLKMEARIDELQKSKQELESSNHQQESEIQALRATTKLHRWIFLSLFVAVFAGGIGFFMTS